VSDQRDERPDGESFEGEEELLGGEPPPSDPYAPGPGASLSQQRAFNVMRLAWIAIAAVVAAILLMAIFGEPF
jgi:hypothetical protein